RLRVEALLADRGREVLGDELRQGQRLGQRQGAAHAAAREAARPLSSIVWWSSDATPPPLTPAARASLPSLAKGTVWARPGTPRSVPSRSVTNSASRSTPPPWGCWAACCRLADRNPVVCRAVHHCSAVHRDGSPHFLPASHRSRSSRTSWGSFMI